MNIVSGTIVALMLLDVLAPMPKPEPPTIEAVFSVEGYGELSVIAASAPTLGSVPKGAQRVPFLTLHLSASCEKDITLDTLTVKHVGLGLSHDIASVYAVQSFRRITRATHFDARSGEAVLRFRGLVVPKCGAAEVEIVGDMSADSASASEHALEIPSPRSIVSSAKKTNLSTGDASERVIASPMQSGTITVRFLRISGRPSYGRIETVARLQLKADNAHSHLLKRITLTNRGTARDMDLQWLSIETLSGKKITTSSPRMKGSVVTLEFNPTHELGASETIVLNLKAEIRGSQTRTIDFHLEEESDLVALPYRGR